jgi:hypothetical protein
VKETHYVELTDKVEREEERVYPFDGYPDPYTASLVLYKNSIQNGEGIIKNVLRRQKVSHTLQGDWRRRN